MLEWWDDTISLPCSRSAGALVWSPGFSRREATSGRCVGELRVGIIIGCAWPPKGGTPNGGTSSRGAKTLHFVPKFSRTVELACGAIDGTGSCAQRKTLHFVPKLRRTAEFGCGAVDGTGNCARMKTLHFVPKLRRT